ncbi:MAG: RecX family transcriptional regulator [Candidatus Sumerlaeia bacterium]|nr:RecX family transcriptional regulator [Candidatus Sumerlaeia bacterium]
MSEGREVRKLGPVPRKPEERRALLADGSGIDLLLDTVVKFRIRAGAPVPEEALAFDRRERARAAAWRLLSRGPQTRTTLRRGLVQRRHRAADADAVIGDLEARGFLDERALAADLAERRANARRGPRMIEAELAMLGVAEEARREATARLREPAAQAELARAALAAFLKRKARLAPEKVREAAWRHLASRGFDADAAREAVEEALGGRDE